MIGRFRTIVRAYIAASVVSGFAVALGVLLLGFVGLLLQARWQDAAASAALGLVLLILLGCLVSLFVVIYTVLPALIVIGLTEGACVRAAPFYRTAGAIAAIVAWSIFLSEDLRWFPVSGLPLAWTAKQALLILVVGAAGLIGGLVYWSMAGVSAGIGTSAAEESHSRAGRGNGRPQWYGPSP